MKKKSVCFIATAVFLVIVIGLFALLPKKVSGVLTSDNFSVNEDELELYTQIKMKDYVDFYRKNYGDEYLEIVALDENGDLKKQKSCYGGTWYDYFKNEAVSELKEVLACCEAAGKQGVTCEEKDIETLQAKFESLAGLDYAEKETFAALSKICALSDVYKRQYGKSLEITQGDISKFFEANKNEYSAVDFDYITVNYRYDFNGEDAINAAEKSAYELATEIAEAIKSEGIESALKKYNDALASGQIEVKLDNIGYPYDDYTQLSEWAFSGERKVNDVTIFKGKSQYSVYRLSKVSYPLDYDLRKIKKIKYNSGYDAGIVKINSIFENLKKDCSLKMFDVYAGQQGESVVEELAYKDNYSESVSSWIYSDDRQASDFTVLEEGSTVYLIQFCGQSNSTYIDAKITETIVNNRINSHITQLCEKYDVKYNE